MGEAAAGNGGGPAARTGVGVAGSTAAIEGRGGGLGRGVRAGLTSSVAAAVLATPKPAEGGWAAVDAGSASAAAAFSLSAAGGLETAGANVAVGSAARNSEIGFQEDFASSQARSVGLKLPSAIFSRMAYSEKRPANCPFR